MNLKNLKAVFIDFGHGYKGDQGAVYNGMTERQVLLSISDDVQRVWSQIKEFSGVQIHYMGLGEVPDSLQDRIIKINKICRANGYNKNNSLLISCHINAGGGRGTEGWYETGNTASADFATCLALSIAKAVNISSRPSKPDYTNRLKRLGILRDTIPLSALIEFCFIDNKDEAAILRDVNKNDFFAVGMLRGLKRFVGVVQ